MQPESNQTISSNKEEQEALQAINVMESFFELELRCML